MPRYRIKINKEVWNETMTRAIGKSPEVKELAYKTVEKVFRESKRAMLREFERHPITAELQGGVRAVNISHTLEGYGNLYSFIGFHRGDDPTEELRNLLEIATSFRQTVYRNRAWYFQWETPSKEAVAKATPMPWEQGNSWAEGVERGISGLSHYMFKRWTKGRSGGGFQLPYENLEDATFSPQPYMTEILGNFRDRMNNKLA